MNTLPNGVTHYNYTWIVVFPMFIFVEYQPFTTLEYPQNHAEKIMNFEHPTLQGVNAMVIRNPGCSQDYVLLVCIIVLKLNPKFE